MSLLLFATITAKPGCGAELKPAFQELVPVVCTEAACLRYEFYESTESPDRFIMYERWTDQAGLDAHANMPHMAAFKEKHGHLIENVVLTTVPE